MEIAEEDEDTRRAAQGSARAAMAGSTSIKAQVNLRNTGTMT